MKQLHNDPNWWYKTVIYQIYPRSFRDSNGDGVGDLQGIIEKLDYIKDLGISSIWLNPVFPSGGFDGGYDITDYYSIDPIFGTMRDFECLLYEAHKRSIAVIIDMVLNHCSSLHPWFVAGSSSVSDPKYNWFVWSQKANNWQSYFGGSAWTYQEPTQQYYYHAYLSQQPDLNWHNPDVRAECVNIIKFWIEKGVDGFRMDAVQDYGEDAKLRDNSDTERNYQINQHDTHVFLAELYAQIKQHYPNTSLLGEVWGGDQTPDYYGKDKPELDIIFDFDFTTSRFKADIIKENLLAWNNRTHGKLPALTLSNHDVSRVVSRLGESKSLLALVVMLTSQAIPVLYYGDEIGMQNSIISLQDIKDTRTLRDPSVPTRDGFRTPMQWNNKYFAGFSDGQSIPYLPINQSYITVNVEKQTLDNQSLLQWNKKLLQLREEYVVPYFGIAEQTFLDYGPNILVYTYSDDKTGLVVIVNTGSTLQHITLNDIVIDRVLLAGSYHSTQKPTILNGSSFSLLGFHFLVGRFLPGNKTMND